jgi:hypothetical protein
MPQYGIAGRCVLSGDVLYWRSGRASLGGGE